MSYRDEVVLMKWEDSRLSPPDDPEPIHRCCDCGYESELLIENQYFCRECAMDKFLFKPECSYCSNEAEFKVDEDYFCEDCFIDTFKI